MTTKEDLESLGTELEEILGDIKEIDKIISDYRENGILNKDQAVNKIVDVRCKNQTVQAFAIASIGIGSMPLIYYDDNALIDILKAQREILSADYLKKVKKENEKRTKPSGIQ